MAGALDGIRVLEINRVAPGSFLTMMLGDMGADVIRIETPAGAAGGELARNGDARVLANDFLNRNKRSLSLNLKDPAGQAILRSLARETDVLVEGFRPGVMKRLGGDYDALTELNPRLVYCSLSGYGQDGPYRDYPAHDINYLSLAGVMSCLGGSDGPPPIPLNLVADYAGATLHGVAGVLLALFARERTGRGQHVDVSYLDTTFALLCAAPNVQDFFKRGTVPERGKGVFAGDYAFYGTYETRDGGLISLGCTEPWLWHNFCDAVDRPDLKDCALRGRDFANSADERHAKARAELEVLMKTRTRDEWFQFLSEHDVCVGSVYSLPEVVTDPQIRHRAMAVELDHPEAGPITQPGIALKLSETPGAIRSFPPARGEHTDAILGELGIGAAEIRDLRGKGVV